MTPQQRKHQALQEALHGQNRKARQYLRDQRRSIAPPFNAAADTAVSGLRNTYDQTMSSLAGQEAQTRQNYGFDDSSNPYSIANQLQTNYKQRKAGSLNSYAAAGQQYSGALQSKLGADQTGYLQNTDTQIRNYQAALGKLAGERVTAQTDKTQGIREARAKALEDAVNAPLDPSAAPQNPKFVEAYLKRQNKRAHRLAKKHPNKALKLKEKLASEQ